jgi:hypothetical protein
MRNMVAAEVCSSRPNCGELPRLASLATRPCHAHDAQVCAAEAAPLAYGLALSAELVGNYGRTPVTTAKAFGY